jgi:hypothetical protein
MKGGIFMPVVVVPYDSRLQLRLVTGIDPEDSSPIIKNFYFSKVKASAAEQDIFDVANQLVSLQKYSLDEIILNETSQLTS